MQQYCHGPHLYEYTFVEKKDSAGGAQRDCQKRQSHLMTTETREKLNLALKMMSGKQSQSNV